MLDAASGASAIPAAIFPAAIAVLLIPDCVFRGIVTGDFAEA